MSGQVKPIIEWDLTGGHPPQSPAEAKLYDDRLKAQEQAKVKREQTAQAQVVAERREAVLKEKAKVEYLKTGGKESDFERDWPEILSEKRKQDASVALRERQLSTATVKNL